MISRALAIAILAGLYWASPKDAAAQDCRQLLVAKAEFCHKGTAWERVPLVTKADTEKQRIKTQYGQLNGKVWLLFSRIPEGQADDLPWFPKAHDVAEIQKEFADGPYKPLGEMIEQFYPLGEDVLAASIATKSTTQPYVNIYTYYILEDGNLVVQTGIQGTNALTDEHKQLHIEAVRAVKDKSG